MNKLTKIAILSTTLLATTLATVETSSARERYPYWRKHHSGHIGNKALAAGAFGLAAGVIVGSALAAPAYRPRYYRARPVYIERAPIYVEPQPVYVEPVRRYVEPDTYYDQGYDQGYDQDDGVQAGNRDYFPDKPRRAADDEVFNSRQAGNFEPWSDQWRTYCSQKYRTFNQRTGTYHGIDGQDHFCTAG